MLFADGRTFQIAGTVLSDGTNVIPFSAITLGAKPSSFPIATTGVGLPMIYVELAIVGEPSIPSGTITAAMSMNEYNTLAIAQSQREQPQAAPIQQSLFQKMSNVVGRRCGACGK